LYSISGICPWCKTFRLFDYGFLAVNAVELEHYAIISLEKLLLLKALAMDIPKYEQDVRLIVKKILAIQYGKES
jgi:hypothetical protein